MKSPNCSFNEHRPGNDSVRGSALVVALILLLVLTILGLASMQSTALQERMAGNFDQRHQAFQLSEMALRSAEREFAEARRRGTGQQLALSSDAVISTWPAACPPLTQLSCSGVGVTADLDCVAAFQPLSWRKLSDDQASGRIRYMEVPLALTADADRCVPPTGISRQIAAGSDAGTGEAISGFDSIRIFLAEGVAGDDTSTVLIQAVFEGPRDQALPGGS